ncbi:IS3 family transposase [Pseudoduganella albidiflava]|uniref:IS3 family transposase n=3 Tax=Pseudoduganella albidiflava TaxID=321983 RepID=A0ABX5RTW2_9BURK|nr:IS3 family transposase [Pseudoduganella albidiflava]QBI01674.1 IS3 family transposase [Pseudoduganella albidiflava]
MAKYGVQFKQEVVDRYRAGPLGCVRLGNEMGVDPSLVYLWIRLYDAHGVAGLEKKQHRHSAEGKLSILQYMWKHELSCFETAVIFNVRHTGSIGQWERCYHSGGIDALSPRPRQRPKKMPTSQPPAPQTPLDEEAKTLEELLKEVNYLRMENAYLKKLGALGSGTEAAACDSAQKAKVITELRQRFPLDGLLEVAGLARSTYYYQQQVAKLGDRDEALKNRVQGVFDGNHGRYGYRRVAAEIRKDGHKVNHKRVQRLMSELGLKSLVRPKKYRSYKGEVGEAADNLLDRDFEAAAMHEKWVTDVTEFNVAGKKLYLSPVMDLCNGEIIAFETNTRPVLSLVTNMVKKALRKLGKDDKPILHSDQGWHYRKPAYRKALEDKNVVQSMSRKGNCLDNAAMESFFAVLKTEYFHLQKFASIEELKKGLVKYIRYYNHKRIKLRLNGLSPVQYRTQLQAA